MVNLEGCEGEMHVWSVKMAKPLASLFIPQVQIMCFQKLKVIYRIFTQWRAGYKIEN